MSENKNESYETVTLDQGMVQRRSNQTRDNQLQNIKA